jgi:hypothetical protein
MHLSLASIGPLVGLVATLVGGWIGHRFTSPKDHDRAAHLAAIARDAAALVAGLNPTASWAELLRMTVDQIATAAGLPTTNKDALERAAAGALSAIGKAPGA